MPIPLLELDDRKFNDLAEELQSLIPRHAPGWTDHNISDPGVMLIELFAWLSEAMLYRINRVPEAGTVRLLELLGARFAAARPLLLTVGFEPINADDEYTLPAGSLMLDMARSSDPGVIFETLEPVHLKPESTSQPVRIRQTMPVMEQAIGVGSGQANQLVAIPGRHIVTPASPFPQHALLTVKAGDAEETWTFVPSLLDSAFDAPHFTIRARTNVISFGDGVHGRIPPAGAALALTYRYAEDNEIHTCGEEVGVSVGKPAQSFLLTQPFLPLDLQPLDDLMPQLWVDGQPWRYQPSFLAMQRGAAEFTVEPKRNAVRFGDGDHGRPPTVGAAITLSYRHTLGTQDEPEVGAFFVAVSGAPSPRYLRLRTCRAVEAGRDPTSLAEAREQVYAILQPHWRAITDEDVAKIVAQRFPEIARVYTLPGCDLSPSHLDAAETSAQAQDLPGHLGVVVMPQTDGVWPPPPQIRQILVLSPDGKRMVAQIEKERRVVLWDLSGAGSVRAVKKLTAYMNMRRVVFSADSRRMVGVSHRGLAWLWNADSGDILARLSPRSRVKVVAFSPDSRRVAVAGRDSFVRVYNAGDGKLVCKLPLFTVAQWIGFSPDGRSLLTVTTSPPYRLVGGGGDATFVAAGRWRRGEAIRRCGCGGCGLLCGGGQAAGNPQPGRRRRPVEHAHGDTDRGFGGGVSCHRAAGERRRHAGGRRTRRRAGARLVRAAGDATGGCHRRRGDRGRSHRCRQPAAAGRLPRRRGRVAAALVAAAPRTGHADPRRGAAAGMRCANPRRRRRQADPG
ncbi:MAG: hypothetical protein R2873_06120 [Caldilineaceae bacterium]